MSKKFFHFQLVGLSDHTHVFCSPVAGSWARSLYLLRLWEVKPAWSLMNQSTTHSSVVWLTGTSTFLKGLVTFSRACYSLPGKIMHVGRAPRGCRKGGAPSFLSHIWQPKTFREKWKTVFQCDLCVKPNVCRFGNSKRILNGKLRHIKNFKSVLSKNWFEPAAFQSSR